MVRPGSPARGESWGPGRQPSGRVKGMRPSSARSRPDLLLPISAPGGGPGRTQGRRRLTPGEAPVREARRGQGREEVFRKAGGRLRAAQTPSSAPYSSAAGAAPRGEAPALGPAPTGPAHATPSPAWTRSAPAALWPRPARSAGPRPRPAASPFTDRPRPLFPLSVAVRERERERAWSPHSSERGECGGAAGPRPQAARGEPGRRACEVVGRGPVVGWLGKPPTRPLFWGERSGQPGEGVARLAVGRDEGGMLWAP